MEEKTLLSWCVFVHLPKKEEIDLKERRNKWKEKREGELSEPFHLSFRNTFSLVSLRKINQAICLARRLP
jgi:hypothetical protein